LRLCLAQKRTDNYFFNKTMQSDDILTSEQFFHTIPEVENTNKLREHLKWKLSN
jgi:hypothetical protein